MRTFRHKGKSLWDHIEDTRAELAVGRTHSNVKAKLEKLRQAILSASANDSDIVFLFEALIKLLEHYPYAEFLSLRSNNDVEDLIAAGGYASIKTSGIEPRDLIDGLLQVYASM
ncbi:MAG: hypothetical protein AAF202_08455, partial [Pseudomonadota bacterium]